MIPSVYESSTVVRLPQDQLSSVNLTKLPSSELWYYLAISTMVEPKAVAHGSPWLRMGSTKPHYGEHEGFIVFDRHRPLLANVSQGLSACYGLASHGYLGSDSLRSSNSTGLFTSVQAPTMTLGSGSQGKVPPYIRS